MSNTKIIPTDKNGNVYYGPTTFAAAENQIDELELDKDETVDLIDGVEAAGYARVAKKLREVYGV